MAIEDEIGILYDVAIGGVGYKLADQPDSDMQWRRARITEDARPTDETPSTEQIGRFSYLNFSSFRGGAGQKFLNRADSDQSSFWRSTGVDPFTEENTLQLSPAIVSGPTNSHGSMGLAATDNQAYLLIDTGPSFGVRSYTLSGDSFSTEQTYTCAGLPHDITIGGGYVWVASDSGIERITPGTSTIVDDWTEEPAYRILWIGDRLAVLRRNSTTDQWVLTTYTGATAGDYSSATGVEEVTGGVFSLYGADNSDFTQASAQLGGLTAGSGFVWFTSWDRTLGSGHVWVWPVNVLEPQSARAALATPAGTVPIDCFYYQGSVFVRLKDVRNGKDLIYQCVVAPDGTLTPNLVVDDAGSSDSYWTGRTFSAQGRFVYFVSDSPGGLAEFRTRIGKLDLSTGGYCYTQNHNSGGTVQAVSMWKGRPAWTVSGVGIFFESATTKRTVGTLDTSIIDGDSARDKRFTQIDMVARSTASSTGAKVEVAYTVDGGTNYTELNDADIDVATVGEATGRSDVDVSARTFGFRFRLTRGDTTTTTPELIVASQQSYLLGADEEVLQMPLSLADVSSHETGSRRFPEPDGATRQLRALEALQGTLVTVHDVDYPVTGSAQTYRLESVDGRGPVVHDRATGRNRVSPIVAMVTLRREIKDD